MACGQARGGNPADETGGAVLLCRTVTFKMALAWIAHRYVQDREQAAAT